MTDPILDLIEATATDPAADQTLKDWILESVVPVLCAEVRASRNGKAPGLPPALAVLAAPAPPAQPRVVKTTRPAARKHGRGREPGPKVPGLKAAMKRAGMLAPELAAKCGVSDGAVDNWIAGRTGVQPHRMQTLTSVLECSVEELTR